MKQNLEQLKKINGAGKNTLNIANKIQSGTSSKSGYTFGAWKTIIGKRKNNNCTHHVKKG